MTVEPRPLEGRDAAGKVGPRRETGAPARRTPASGFNWFRFWVRAALAMLAFNIVAAILTVYVIFPWLHRTH